jgi:hypothetical protein
VHALCGNDLSSTLEIDLCEGRMTLVCMFLTSRVLVVSILAHHATATSETCDVSKR